MKLISHVITLAAIALAAATPPPASAASNILHLSSTQLTDSAIVFPESYQTDVHRMQQNWYLQNYTVLSNPSPSGVPATDDVIISRLTAMPTTIEMPFNQVVRSHIDLYVDRRRSLVETMLGMSLFYMPIFEEALEREGLPLELRYLPIIESALNPDAVSRAGATGLWQFMLNTARGMGLEINTLVDERRDPIRSTEMAAKYLRQLHDIYGDWGLAIAAYNCGPGNINKALVRAGSTEQNPLDYWDIYYYLPAETRGYVPGFIAANYAMTYYGEHGISPALARKPIVTDTVHVNSRIEMRHVAEVLGLPIEELRLLNPQYRKDVIPGDIKPYALRLPSQLVYAYLLSEDSISSLAQASPLRRPVVDVGGNRSSMTEEVVWHKVKRGETLAKIAQKYGVSAAEIKKWNNLRSSKVSRGTNLKIIKMVAAEPDTLQVEMPVVAATDSLAPVSAAEPVADTVAVEPTQTAPAKAAPAKTSAPKAKTHKVKKGETVWKIAQRYGTTVDKILKLNGLNSKSKIIVGQTLKIS